MKKERIDMKNLTINHKYTKMTNFQFSSSWFSSLMMVMFVSLTAVSLNAQCGNAYIAGVMDGDLSGGTPKAIQICANGAIADLSIYGIGSANNGGGTDGEEYTFPAGALAAGDCVIVASESAQFTSFFGCAPDYVDGTASINGDDAIELFCSGAVEDVFGDINTSGTGLTWEYLDGWAYSTDALASGSTFDANWSYSGINALDGETTNASATTPFPSDPCSSCAITAITAGFQTTCVVADNTYTQEVTVSYSNAPATGMLVVNGQSFAITTSPQMVVLSGLNSDGNAVSVTANFSANMSCSFTETDLFTAAAQCGAAPCDEVVITAAAFCADGNNNFVQDAYYIEVSNISGGSSSANFAVTDGSSTQTYTGTTLVFGPYPHSISGSAIQTISANENNAFACTGTSEVVETFCRDLNFNGAADNNFSSCDCVAAAANNNGGTILAQSAPGTFASGGSSGFLQQYLVVDGSSGIVSTVVSNSIGYFTGLAAGTYYVYAINYKVGEAPNVLNTFTFNSSIDLAELTTNTGTYLTDCYTACGPAIYTIDCSEDQASLGCNSGINVTVDSECEASRLSVNQFIEGPAVDPSQYELIITTQSGEVVDFKNLTSTIDDNVFNYIGQSLIYTISHVCSSATCWGNVLLEDKTPPELDCDCPVGGNNGTYDPECTFACYEVSLTEGLENLPSDIASFVNNNIEDNCFNYTIEGVHFEDDLSDFGMCGGSLLRRTWIVSYTANGSTEVESISCTREYSFEPLDLSTLVTITGPVANPLNGTVYLPVRTVELNCVVETDPASIATSKGAAYAYPHIYVNGQAIGIDDNLCNMNTTYTDTNTEGCAPGCKGESKILRSWAILDWCTSELEEYLQVIKLVDDQGPLMALEDDMILTTIGNSCEQNVALPAPQALGDFCEDQTSYTVTGTSGDHAITGNESSGYTAIGLGIGTHEVYYSATDCCGNESTATMMITIKDEQSPNVIAVEFIAISVTTPIQGEVFSIVQAVSIDNGSYDNCSSVTLEIRRESDSCRASDDEFGEAVHFCCDDMDENGWAEIPVQLRVTDECGNSNTVWSKVQIQDKSTTNLSCPDGMLVNCGDSINDLDVTGMPSSAGICGEITLDYEVSTEPASKPADASPQFDYDGDGLPDEVTAYDETCGYGAMKREFREENNVICTQYFVFAPSTTFDSNSIIWPSDVTVNCSNYNSIEPQFTVPACGNVVVALESDTFPITDNFCYAVIHHWTVIDWCRFDQTNGADGKYTRTQNVKISDSSAPVISAEAQMTFELSGEDCLLDNLSIPVSAMDMDGCPLERLNWTITVDYDTDGTIDVTRNESSFPGDTFNLQLTDIPSGFNSHLVSWSAEDDCGNVGMATTSLTVEDRTSPQAYCIGVTTAVDTSSGTFELWAIDFNAGASDNCSDASDLRFTFTDQEPPAGGGYYDPHTGLSASVTDFQNGSADSYNTATKSSGRIFSENDLDVNGYLNVSVYIWDESGNFDFCIVHTLISHTNIGSRAVVQGRFVTELGNNISEVQTSIEDMESHFVQTNNSDLEGQYAFPENTMHKDYVIKGAKENDYLNGVSTFDLIQIQRHVLGQSMLDSPYKMIAADVTGDLQINGLDLVELRKLILGLNNNFPNSESWVFVDESQELTLLNPWIYRDSVMIENLSTAMMQENFIGVKIGDVDNSNISAANMLDASKRSRNQMWLSFEDRQITEGEAFSVVLKPSEVALYGYQFKLSFSGLQLEAVTGRDIAEQNIATTETTVAISHNSDYLMTDDKDFILLSFVAEASGQLSEMISLDEATMHAEGYLGKFLEVKRMVLTPEQEHGFKLYQNRPNPFSEKTIIEFDLPQASTVRLSLYEVTGKMFKSITQDFGQGHHSLSLSKDELGTSGVIYYRLESGPYTAMKQMIILN